MTNTYRVTFKTIYFNEEDDCHWMKSYCWELGMSEYCLGDRLVLHKMITEKLPSNESLLGIDYIREL